MTVQDSGTRTESEPPTPTSDSSSTAATGKRPASTIAERVYPEQRFGGYAHVDSFVAFFCRVQALLGDQDTVLDVGCGRGKYIDDPCRLRRKLCDLRGPGRRVIGIDVDEDARSNPLINEYRPIVDLQRWPVEDSSIDLLVANSVVEHVQNPPSFFSEAYRVLRPGGYLCVRTYNTWSYIGIAARLIPNKYHSKVTSKVQPGRRSEDVFPTVYRCNTRRRLSRAIQNAGFDCYVYAIESEPNYLGFSNLAYRIGAMIHAILPPAFRWTLLAFGRKPPVHPNESSAKNRLPA